MAGPMGRPMGGPGGKKGMHGPMPKPKNAKGTIRRLLKYILEQKGLFFGVCNLLRRV